jgi:NADH-quinone oxidoreductase subunit J
MVLFLFVVMLLNVEPDQPRLSFVSFRRWWFGLLAGVFMVTITLLIGRGTGRLSLAGSDVEPGFGDVEQVAQALFTRYLLPFETAALLLTVALVGTVFLAKRRI